MVASRGQLPVRTEERRRTNKTSGENDIEVTRAASGSLVEVPAADDDWHFIAQEWYLSLEDSGQSHFYEQSDWWYAYMLAENLSRMLKPVFVGMEETWNSTAQSMEKRAKMLRAPFKGGELSAMLHGMTNLLVTEGDRRRMRLELTKMAVPAVSVAETAQGKAMRLLGVAK